MIVDIDDFAQRQALILAELGKALRIEREVRGQTASLVVQAHDIGSLGKGDLDNLQSAELNQREVSQTLTGTGQSVVAEIDRLHHLTLRTSVIGKAGMGQKFVPCMRKFVGNFI